jgi:hypothetical protein
MRCLIDKPDRLSLLLKVSRVAPKKNVYDDTRKK